MYLFNMNQSLISKTLKIIVLLCLFFAILPKQEMNAKEHPILSVSTVYESKRTSVDLSVYLQGDVEIASGSFDIQYDPQLLTIQDKNVQVSSIFASKEFLTVSNGANEGTVSLAFANESGENLEGTLLTFKATLKQVPELVELNLSNVHFYDDKGKEIDVVTMDGVIKPFDGVEKEHGEKVANNRPWTVSLSSPVKKSSLNEQAVSVKDRYGKTVEIEIQFIDSKKFKVYPKNPYSKGTYTLEITDKLLSENGTQLKEPVRFMFTVQ